MVMNDTQQLLTEYARSGSEAAFAELVSNYINLVYSTAVRMLGEDAHLANDATQIVFVNLARKASTLSGDVQLGGWLHRHTCLVAANMRRSERRRRSREGKAVAMNTQEDHSEAKLAQVLPLLDEAINELGAADRTAILLRYFEQHDFSAVGAALGSSENAAQKRVARALDELRSLLKRRGVVLSAAMLGTLLAASASAAPAGLAATVSGAALTAAAASGIPFNLSLFLLTNKLKLSILSGILIAVVAALLAIHFQSERRTIAFDGQHWHAWRTQFALRGDKLVSLPKARAGFNYGSDGGGRGPLLFSNVGNRKWKDYRAEFEFCVAGIDPAFNPYELPLDYHDGEIWFHVADAKESWNERGASAYILGVHGDGTWFLRGTYNEYCAVPRGFGLRRKDGERRLAEGAGLKIDCENGNKYAVEVKGQRIQVWIDGEKIADVIDERMGETIGGQTLDHGGIGFVWGYDTMGWIRNLSLSKP